MAGTRVGILAVLLLPAAQSLAVDERTASAQAMAMNPIRRVVQLLQSMQKKVEAEGEREKKLYDKFMCHCKGGGSDLSASVSAAQLKIPAVGSGIEASEEKL